MIGEVSPRPWLHVNAVGADFPGKVEIPQSLLDTALVVPDRKVQCLLEGECQQLGDAQVGPELWQLVQQSDGFDGPSRVTVFDSTGWATEDDAALRLAYRIELQHDLGTDIVLESISSDPYEPYSPLVGI